MTDPIENQTSEAPQEQPDLPALPSLVMPKIKITDENSVVVAAARLRVIRDQYSSSLQSTDQDFTFQLRQQFKRDIEDLIGLLDRAWNVLQQRPSAQLPRTDTQEAQDAIEAVLKERNYPSSSLQAGRAGYEAARRMTLPQQGSSDAPEA